MNIANDDSKKKLVGKLIKSGKISLDEGLQLLQEGVQDLTFWNNPFPIVTLPYAIPITPQYPLYPVTWTVQHNYDLKPHFISTC